MRKARVGMLRSAALLAAAVVVAAGCESPSASSPVSVSMARDFHDDGIRTVLAIDFAMHSESGGSAAREAFQAAALARLGDWGRYEIVAPDETAKHLAEKGLVFGDLIDPDRRAETAREMGADAILTGSVNRYRRSMSSQGPHAFMAGAVSLFDARLDAESWRALGLVELTNKDMPALAEKLARTLVDGLKEGADKLRVGED